MPKTDSPAAGITWNLTDLYDRPDDPRIGQDLAQLTSRAETFESTWRGAVAGGISAEKLATALTEVEAISEGLGILSTFAFLTFAGDTRADTHKALYTRIQEASTDIRARMLFLDLEWAALPDELADPLTRSDELARFRHHLIKARDFKPYLRPEGEEIILDLKANTGARALSRLFDETMARIRFDVEVNGKSRNLSEEETLSLLSDPVRDTRKAAADALTEGLSEQEPLLTFIFNTLVADHASDDRIRSLPGPMTARNLSNEISQESVDALLTSCDKASPMVHDYYRVKRTLMQVDDLYDYDRYAPLEAPGQISFDEARDIVLESFGAFSPRMAEIAELFFTRRWIDAEVREGKQGGAFSHPVVPSRHPYVMLNYLGRPRDVMVLAHELGHGIHQYLARDKGYFGADTPLTTAETASVFGEMLVFSALKARQSDPAAALGLLCGKLEDTFSTVFRQVVMTRFEQAAHTARREEGELTAARIGTLWMDVNRPMFGDALCLRDDYARWWSYIPHFIHTPFYCYAYAYGELLVLSLYARYLEEGDAFVPRYLELLAAGGTGRPEQLLSPLGVDITAPDFWDGGLAVIRGWVREAETCVAERTAKTG